MSLRGRLLLIAVVLLTVGLVVSDAVVTAALRRHLVARVDNQLRPITLVLSRVDPGILDGAVRPESLPATLDLINALSVAYLDTSGKVVDTVSSGTSAPSFPASLADVPVGTAVDLRGTDGSGWRAVVAPRPGGNGVVVVAAPLSAIDATILQLRVVCLITGLIVIALLSAVGWVAMGTGLRPLRRIEETATAIASGDLSRRIPDAGPSGTEVAQLTDMLNAMLTQIERAFAVQADSEARMRRFVADVSHELRTPLFGIKGSAELHLMRDDASPGDVDAAMRRIDTEAGRLGALVDDLLLLARLDEPAAGPVLDLTPMDLRTLAADARYDLRSLDPARPVRLTGLSSAEAAAGDHAGAAVAAAPGAASVLGDEARLRQVVSNLVGNVHAHTPASAPVRIGVGRMGADAVLEVADSGPGLTEEEVARAFERFSRADGSRARGSGPGAGRGAGLGLAIVRSLTTAHGGRVEVVPTPGGGATFRLCLPWVEPVA